MQGERRVRIEPCDTQTPPDVGNNTRNHPATRHSCGTARQLFSGRLARFPGRPRPSAFCRPPRETALESLGPHRASADPMVRQRLHVQMTMRTPPTTTTVRGRDEGQDEESTCAMKGLRMRFLIKPRADPRQTPTPTPPRASAARARARKTPKNGCGACMPGTELGSPPGACSPMCT